MAAAQRPMSCLMIQNVVWCSGVMLINALIKTYIFMNMSDEFGF